MKGSIALAGYFAVLQRLRTPTLPLAGDGTTGRRETPTLTCDAVLVALQLWERGLPGLLIASHPGGEATESRIATDFLRERTLELLLGPDLGAPFELEVATRSDRRIWLNDPLHGVRSLEGLQHSEKIVADVLYVDAYPWLASAALRLVARLRPVADVVYVNLGQMEEHDLPDRARPWLNVSSPALFLQASIPGIDDDAAFRQRVLQRARSLGAALVIVTSGGSGLGLVTHGGSVWTEPKTVDRFRDSTGAGAAVSAACLEAIVRGNGAQLAELGERLSIAGATQCGVDGGIPGNSRDEWVRDVSTL